MSEDEIEVSRTRVRFPAGPPKQMKRVVVLFVLLCAGCTKTATSSGIPNLAEVEPGLWRSGQPTTQSQWQWLKDHGVKHVIKLNFDSEGSDEGAHAVGLDVHELSIQPEGDLDWIDDITHTFVRPDPAVLDQIESVIEMGNVLVHCQHGQDRTGIVVARYRVIHEHWTKDRAYSEALAHGFHPELRGLRESWEHFNETSR